MRFAIFLIAALLPFTASAAKPKVNDFSAGFTFENLSCGSLEPTFSISYDRDNDSTPAHFRMSGGPNGSCTGQGISLDAVVEKRQYLGGDVWYVVAGGGIREQTQAFEYLGCLEDFKCYAGYAVRDVSARGGFGFDGGEWSVQLTYGAVENRLCQATDVEEDMDGMYLRGGECDPDADNAFPLQLSGSYRHRFMNGDLELNASTNTEFHALNATWDYGVIELSADFTFDYGKLNNGAPYMKDGGLTRADPPGTTIQLGARWNF